MASSQFVLLSAITSHRGFQQAGRQQLSSVAPLRASPAPNNSSSLICSDCEGNGAKVCSQCKGDGLNKVDHFRGQFKAGTICWLCRGKRQILCGTCNGAGYVGGFLNAMED